MGRGDEWKRERSVWKRRDGSKNCTIGTVAYTSNRYSVKKKITKIMDIVPLIWNSKC